MLISITSKALIKETLTRVKMNEPFQLRSCGKQVVIIEGKENDDECDNREFFFFSICAAWAKKTIIDELIGWMKVKHVVERS